MPRLRVSLPFPLESGHAWLHHQSHAGGTTHHPTSHLEWCSQHSGHTEHTEYFSLQPSILPLSAMLLSTCNAFLHPSLLPKVSVQVSVQSHFPIACFVVLPLPPTACLIISLLSKMFCMSCHVSLLTCTTQWVSG